MKSKEWIKVRVCLREDPRVISMAQALGAKYPLQENALISLVLGALTRFWSYADTYIRDGEEVLPIGVNYIDQIVGVEGFAKVLPGDWLQVIDAQNVKLPNFQLHNSPSSKTKALNNARMKSLRAPVVQEDIHKNNTDIESSAQRVFRHWATEYGRVRTVFTVQRQHLIERALEYYDPQTLMDSISGYKNSAHHMGQNSTSTVYNDIELLLRDAKHIEGGLQFAQRGAVMPASAVEMARQRLDQYLQEKRAHASVEPDRGGEDPGSASMEETSRLFR